MSGQRTNWLKTDEAEVGDVAAKKILVIVAIFFLFFLVLGFIGQVLAQPKIKGFNMPIAYKAQADKGSGDELKIFLKEILGK